MKILVLNESPDIYNLGTRKIQEKYIQEGHEVTYINRPATGGGAPMFSLDVEKAFISAIFTWDLPNAVQDANDLLQHHIQVEIGGPAATVMPDYVVKGCGIQPHMGVDPRFEFIKGDFELEFTSRGCPRGCEFCLVKLVEGKKMIEYPDFNIPTGDNPKIGDNNLLATSWAHQQMVVDKIKHVKNLDINSGYDCRIFSHDPEKYFNLYKNLKTAESWRFAYDKPDQQEHLKKCVEYLHAQGIGYRKITVFCLIGFPGTTFEECRQKLQFLRDIDTSPYPQRYRPFDTTKHNFKPEGWKEGDMELLFGYYGVGYVYKSCTWEEYLETETLKLKPVPENQGRLL